jgi:putative MATE family efflux protein
MPEPSPSAPKSPVPNPDPRTIGVALLTGDPKKAILILSGPMIVVMLLMASYSLVNAIWVAGLGADALAAVGFVSPLFMVLIGIGNGLGAGATSVISRRIGADDHAGANSAAVHAILLTIILSAIATVPLVLFADPILIAFGAGETLGLAMQYGQIVFCGTILILVTSVMAAILRAEGDTKRTMYVLGASSILNMILDPILIYWAGMGIAGAAWGMIISQVVVLLVLLYWFFVKRDTYISLSWKEFVPDRKITRDILGVGLPASTEFFMMSILAILVNFMLVMVAGTDAVAVYTAGWRLVMFAVIPLVGIAMSVVAVAGAAYGGRHYDKLGIIHNFSTLFGLAIALCTSVITWLFSQQIAVVFTYSPETAYLAPTIAAFLGVMCLFYPFVPPGMMSTSIFQGVGKGITSLTLNILRNLVFIAVFAYMLGIVLGMGEQGIWWGIVAGDILGGLVSYAWARVYISRLRMYS